MGKFRGPTIAESKVPYTMGWVREPALGGQTGPSGQGGLDEEVKRAHIRSKGPT